MVGFKKLVTLFVIFNIVIPVSAFAKPSNEEVRYYQEILDRITKTDESSDIQKIRDKINVDQALENHEKLEPSLQREFLVKGIYSAMEFLNGHLNGQLEGEVSEFCKGVEKALPEDIASKNFPRGDSTIRCPGLVCGTGGFVLSGLVIGLVASLVGITFLTSSEIFPYYVFSAFFGPPVVCSAVGFCTMSSVNLYRSCSPPPRLSRVKDWMDSTFADPKMQFPYYKEILHYIAILGKRPVGQKQINRLKKIMNNPGLLEEGLRDQGIDEGTELRRVVPKKSKKQSRTMKRGGGTRDRT